MKGVTIILMKGYTGKSRLVLDQNYRRKLIDALAIDLYNTVLETNILDNSWNCFIATPDKFFSKKCKKKNIPILELKSGELNSIFYQIQNWVVENGYDFFILCAGDVPLLNGALIDEIKRKLTLGVKKKGKSMIICPSKSNGVSIIAMSPADLWMITTQKGVENLQVIKGLNRDIYPYQVLKDARSYFDLDHKEDLQSVLKFMKKNPVYRNRLVRKLLYEYLTVKSH